MPTKPYEIKTVKVHFPARSHALQRAGNERKKFAAHWELISAEPRLRSESSTRNGTILRQGRTPMIANSTAEAALDAVVSAIDSMFSTETEVESIGICAPGPLDPTKGIVLNPPNLPCWRNFPLAEKISARYKVPVKVDNDANAAALAETLWGAARGFHYVFYATVGTGIGTGIVFNGGIYHGRPDRRARAAM